MQLLSPETASPERLRVVMEMLCKTTSKVGKLHRDFPLTATDLTTRCLKIRQTLELLLRLRGELKASKYIFDSSEVLATKVLFRIHADVASGLLMPATDAKARAAKNLQGFQLFGNRRSFAKMGKHVRFF